MINQILNGRFFGHPIHPMLVHFPTALFSAGFIFDVGGIVLNEPYLFPASLYVILLGLAFGILAGLFGIVDYIKLGERTPVFHKASWHAGIQFVVLIGFGTIAGIKLQTYLEFIPPSPLQITVTGIMLIMMLFANYLGGDLVFTHRIGIDEKS